MSGICEGRVVIVTGAGRGLGREHALEFARQGANVVVNDLGAEIDGTGGSSGPAGEVVAEIEAMGGEAVVNGDDVADWDEAERLMQHGGRHLRPARRARQQRRLPARPHAGQHSEDEWDAVVNVHLKGHFAPPRTPSAYWRDQAKAGEPVDARIINTCSGAGLHGHRSARATTRRPRPASSASPWCSRPSSAATASPPTPSPRPPAPA